MSFASNLGTSTMKATCFIPLAKSIRSTRVHNLLIPQLHSVTQGGDAFYFSLGLQSWVHVSGVHSGIFLLIEHCGVAGVLEVNFVQPAHDKQGIECTTILARLESCLLQMFVHLMWDKKKQCILLAQAFC